MAVTRTLETTGDAGELFIGFSIDVVLALINFPEKSHANSSFAPPPPPPAPDSQSTALIHSG